MRRTIEIDFQNPNNLTIPASIADFTLWAETALREASLLSNASLTNPNTTFDMTVRVVDEEEAQELNATYRGKNYATNVLSFPFETPDNIDLDLLGDIVICDKVVTTEAKIQHKNVLSHWAHLTIHGTLHLLGFDHEVDEEAQLMESIEIKALASLGYANPYKEEPSTI